MIVLSTLDNLKDLIELQEPDKESLLFKRII